LTVPLIYHDGDKELALVVVPGNLQLAHSDEQKIIGDLSNRLMNSLPPEERKAYLFNPQTFFNLEGLIKAVLEADGITEEVIETRQAKIRLLQEMLKAPGETELKKLVEEQDAELDFQYFEILTASALQAFNQGDEEQGQSLLNFRQMILQWSSQGSKVVAEIDEKFGLQALTPEALLEQLVKAQTDEQIVDLVRSGKPLLDYQFLQNLTGRIEAEAAGGNKDEAERLKALRSRVLDASAKVEEENKRMITQAAQLLDQLIKAPDLKEAVLQNLGRLDDAFFALLSAQIQQANQAGQADTAQKLFTVYQEVATTVQEQMPPELRLLNELMQTESPEAITAGLERNRAMITPKFIEALDKTLADLTNDGRTQLAERVTAIKAEAERIMQSGSIILP